MAEVAIASARSAVYYYDVNSKNWSPADGGISVISIYQNKSNNTMRIVAISSKTNQAVINSPVHKDLKYIKASEQFGQFQDARYMYGLNFATKQESENFATVLQSSVTALASGGVPEIPPVEQQPPIQQEEPEPAPQEPEPEPAPQEPEPKPEPVKPEPVKPEPVKPTGNNNVMNDLASKIAARKNMVENSSPTPAPSQPNPPKGSGPAVKSTFSKAGPAIKSNSGGSTKSNGGRDPALDSFKEEILAQIREEMQAVKNEILDALRNR